jgi:GAF domain-containing protein
MYDPRVVAALVEMLSASPLAAADAPRAHAADRRPDTLPTPEQILEGAGDQLSLELFFDLGRALPAALSAPQLGKALWSHIRGHIPGSAFVFYVYEQDTDSLAPAFRIGEQTVGANTRVALGDRLSGWVAASGQSIVNSDPRLDLDPELRASTTLRSALAVPVTRGSHKLGVLAFYSRRADAFDDRHERIAAAAAYVVGASLHNAAHRLEAVAV